MRKILLILTGLAAVVVAVVAILLSQIDVSAYKEQALAQVEKATGRKASIDGNVKLSISLTPAIVAEGIHFANANWGSRPDMATIKHLEIQVALLPLLRGGVEVKRFILIEPDVLLEKNRAGKGNWEIAPASTAAKEGAGKNEMPPIDIGTVLVKQLKLVYRDAASGKTTAFSIDTLRLKTSDAGQMELQLKAALDNTAINVNGKLGSLARLFDNRDYPVDIRAGFGPAVSTLKGVVKQPLQAKGLNLTASFKAARLADLNPLTGGKLPAAGPVSVSATLSDAGAKYRLADIQFVLGETSLNGNVTADMGGKTPSVKATLHSPVLDLRPFQSAPAAKQKKLERYFTEAPLPRDALHAVNADITFKADKILSRQATLTNFDTRLKLDDGKLVIKPLSVQVAQGTLKGSVKLDASQKQAGLVLNLRGRKIQLGKLESLRKTLTGGATDITLRLRGKGNSTRAIASGAEGKLLVQVGSATIKREEKKGGFLASLGELVNPFSRKDNAMLDCAVLNFKINRGIARANRGIGIETRQVTVSGNGDINLGNEKLALVFEPHATGAIAGAITNLASGMQASGTLAEPKIKISPAGVAMGVLKSVAGGAGSIVSSILGRKSDAAPADTAPCRTALTGKATPAKVRAKTKTTAKPNKIESIKKKVLDTPKKLLEGLFN